jgi:taurine dioxygenase
MTLDVHPLSYGLGAEIRGVDLSRPLDADTVGAIRRAWLDHGVLLFRDQDISPEDHIRFSRHFGPVEDYPLVHYRHPEHPEIFLLSNRDAEGRPAQTRNAGRHWHSDLSFTVRPALGSVQRCLKIPDIGGDTIFANQYLAYETLSPAFRAFIDPLEAVHELFSKTKDLKNLDQGQVRDMKKANPRVVQPVVRVHPETGRKALYVSVALTTNILGLSAEESDAVLDFLFAHQTQVQFTYRHRWRPNDVLMWDNRCTLHMAVPDNDHRQARLMHRTSISGTPCGRVLDEDRQEAA